MKKFWSYARYSNVQLVLNLNPLVWGFHFERIRPSDLDPGLHAVHIKVLMFRLSIVIDDGSW